MRSFQATVRQAHSESPLIASWRARVTGLEEGNRALRQQTATRRPPCEHTRGDRRPEHGNRDRAGAGTRRRPHVALELRETGRLQVRAAALLCQPAQRPTPGSGHPAACRLTTLGGLEGMSKVVSVVTCDHGRRRGLPAGR
jgi:hypothetical protein